MKLLDGLNTQQLMAVTSPANHICTLAGAGSGKTRVLTTRISYLHQCRVGTSSMLALTFTRLAAKEMKERLAKMIGETEVKNLFCGTFHSFCVKVIKEWGHLVDIDPNFTIYEEEDRQSIIEAIISDLGYRKVKLKTVLEQLQVWDKALPEGDLGKVMAEYYYRLRQNNALDLDLLLYKCTEILLEHEEVRYYYRNIYRYVFVDEYQDTSNPQDSILKLMDPEHLFVVGDDFQAIYGWRGANVQNILLFNSSIKYPDAEVIKLETNYRSTRQIIGAANRLIAHNENQTEKTLEALKDGPEIQYWVLENEEKECQQVANAISHLKVEDDWSDFAVLARNNKQLEKMKAALDQASIPVRMISSSDDVFKRQIVKGVIRFIEAAHNPTDDMTVKMAFKFPEQRVTQLEMDQIELVALDNDVPLMDVFEHSESPKAKDFSKMIYDIYQMMTTEDNGAVDIFRNACQVMGLESYLSSCGLVSRIEELKKAINDIWKWVLVQRELGESEDYAAFLKWLRTKDIQDRLVQDSADAVKLLTVHGAKGLEFKTVFIIGMNQGVFPSKRSEDIEEERRLMYVAITRAKEQLFITRARERVVWGTKTEPTQTSQFITESANVIAQAGA